MPKKSVNLTPVLIFALWTCLALVYASHLYFYHALRDGAASWRDALGESFSDWYVWAALSIPILSLARRIPLNSVRHVLLHVPLSLVFSLIQVAIHAVIDQWLIHGALSRDSFSRAFDSFFARTYHFGLLVYWLIVIARTAVERYKNQQLAAAQLETKLSQAQLQALRMQLHPHFLFNTLNTIASLMHSDVAAADRMVVKLSELLRIALSTEHSQEVCLSEELEFVRKYLDIEQERFRDRLEVQFQVDPETLDARIPVFLLQPLVENSIRHGIAKNPGSGKLEIEATRVNGRLRVRVGDNGCGISPSDVQEGIGLSNTRLRLQQLYGSDAEFTLSARAGKGTDAVIFLPFHSERT